jgi:hypothetical protein
LRYTHDDARRSGRQHLGDRATTPPRSRPVVAKHSYSERQDGRYG